jgi:hypothetical protein
MRVRQWQTMDCVYLTLGGFQTRTSQRTHIWFRDEAAQLHGQNTCSFGDSDVPCCCSQHPTASHWGTLCWWGCHRFLERTFSFVTAVLRKNWFSVNVIWYTEQQYFYLSYFLSQTYWRTSKDNMASSPFSYQYVRKPELLKQSTGVD